MFKIDIGILYVKQLMVGSWYKMKFKGFFIYKYIEMHVVTIGIYARFTQ